MRQSERRARAARTASTRRARLASRRATSGATYSAPTMKRISGPKLFNAGGPTRYSPGTEVSKLRDTTGIPVWVRNDRRRGSLRKSRRSMSGQ